MWSADVNTHTHTSLFYRQSMSLEYHPGCHSDNARPEEINYIYSQGDIKIYCKSCLDVTLWGKKSTVRNRLYLFLNVSSRCIYTSPYKNKTYKHRRRRSWSPTDKTTDTGILLNPTDWLRRYTGLPGHLHRWSGEWLLEINQWIIILSKIHINIRIATSV